MESRDTFLDEVGGGVREAMLDPRVWDRRQSTPRTADSINPSPALSQFLTDRFRCRSVDVAEFAVAEDLSFDSGFFRFGADVVCYGQCSSGAPAKVATEPLHEALDHVIAGAGNVQLPFDPVQVVDNLRCERYLENSLPANRFFRNAYYRMRPLLPVSVRRHFQKLYLSGWNRISFPAWPVDRTVENIFERMLILSMRSCQVDRLPFIWFWPEGVGSCTMITHDVETPAGVDSCTQLMDLADSFGIKSSFQIVPEDRYPVPASLPQSIRKRGFEVNVHDLNHDGHLFSDLQQFLERADQINRYAREFEARGFRAGVMYRNVDWFDALDVSYDMSIPNVAHLDPQRGGCCTVLPFFVGNLLELPLTTTQDYSLFHILNDRSIRLWKEQMALIREKHGLVSVIIHPDYFTHRAARRLYAGLLEYVSEWRSRGETWIALPREVDAWWRQRSQMELVKTESSWSIEGAGSERARVAWAVLDGGRLQYELG